MNMKTNLLVFGILLVLITVLGCTSSKYQEILITKQGVSFIFKCPITYQNQEKTPTSFESASHVGFLRPNGKTITIDPSNINTGLNIYVYDTTSEYPNAKTYLDKCLQGYSISPNYELFERSPIVLSGVESEFVSYKVKSGLSGEYLDSQVSYYREVYLDYKDKIWVIGAFCYKEMTSQVENEFSQIISSFKFLN
jgi:hypothetical protein